MIAVSQWPPWAMATFAGLFLLALFIKSLQSRFEQKPDKDHPAVSNAVMSDFKAFRSNYLIVFYIVMFADWLQGTTMYTLYQSYGVNISLLFLTGFSASAIFGTFIGSLADRFGRRNGCILFCVLEIVINTMEHSPDFTTLLIGRILGGISTSLLFSTFESWMVTEHRKRGFPDHLLASTFSLASEGNGIAAIIAGIVAQIAIDLDGNIGPFRVAIALTALALYFIVQWPENYGEDEDPHKSGHPHNSPTMLSGFKAIFTRREISLLGFVEALFEGSMYTFVFMWVPSLMAVYGTDLPLGLVFSCLMVCVTIGGLLFELATRRVSAESYGVVIFVVAAAALSCPALVESFPPLLICFCVFEICVGSYFPCAGLLRSKYFPEHVMSTVMNIFRIPLNMMVVTGTMMTDSYPRQTVFTVCTVWLLITAFLQFILYQTSIRSHDAPVAQKAQKSKKKK